MLKNSIILLMLLLFLHCTWTENVDTSTSDHVSHIALDSNPILTNSIKEVILAFINENNISKECTLRVQVNRIDYYHTSINLFAFSQMPLLGDHTEFYLKTFVASIPVFFDTNLDRYLNSNSPKNKIMAEPKTECDYFGLAVDSMGVIKFKNNVGADGMFYRDVKTLKKLVDF